MDWNKSNNILIIAFLVVNIFLFSFIYFSNNSVVNNDLKEKEEFLNSVKEILSQKSITISCDVPTTIYKAPFLELEYDIIHPNKELIETFIGEYDGIINDEILVYENEYESIEIVGMKKIIYTKISDTPMAEARIFNFSSYGNNIDSVVNDFCVKNKIDLNDFIKLNEIENGDNLQLIYVEKHGDFNLENSYAIFNIKNGEVVRFEMQKVARINERADIKSISATEALLRLMTIDSINNKEVVDIKICYYTKEDEDFKSINSINADLVWKVIFNDNTYVHLTSEDVRLISNKFNNMVAFYWYLPYNKLIVAKS